MATVVKRGNTFTLRASCGLDGEGKRIRKNMTWTPEPGMTAAQALKEAKHQAVLFEERCRKGQILDSNMKFNEFVEIWLSSYAESELSPKTLDRYKSLLVRIQKDFGNKKLDEIQPHHLNIFYQKLARDDIRGDVKYHAIEDLRLLLRERRITQTELAKRTNIAVNTIASAVSAKNVRQETAIQLCKALKLDFNTTFSPAEQKPLASQTRRHYHRLLSAMFNLTVLWGALFNNPCERVKAPKVEPTKPRYLDEEQAAILIEAVESQDSYQYEVMVKLLLYTGMRRGELCGLMWRDVNYAKSVLSINRALLYTPSLGVYIDKTKNFTSTRTIKLPLVAIHILKDYQKWQSEYKRELGSAWVENGFLFTAQDGKYINPNSFTKWFVDFVKTQNLPRISPHSIRHTNASLQIAGGVSITALANRLGHGNPTTTSKIYSHAIRSADEAAAEVLQDILAPMSNRKKKRA
jgi:integrase